MPEGEVERVRMGIEGLDTRALTRHIRDHGAQTGVLSTADLDPASLVDKARRAPTLEGRDLIKEVTCRAPYAWNQGDWALGRGYRNFARGVASVIVDARRPGRPGAPGAEAFQTPAWATGDAS